ncbi:MAG: alpha/beta hydrolase [Armatimonadetes bacterium]|nr:alpha/beta hydrolase [Anaerolineae bacterium]
MSSDPRLLQIGAYQLAALAFNVDQPGTPLIFLHGITSSIQFWAGAPADYLKERRWYALSLPGHYPATFPAGFTPDLLTAELIADVLIAGIRQLVGEAAPVILIGHSTGGFAALAVAARAPDLVQGVVSVSGFAVGKWSGALGISQGFAREGVVGRLLFHANFHLVTLTQAIYKAVFRVYAADVQALYSDPALAPTLDLIYPYARRLDLDAMLAYFKQMPLIDITEWLPNVSAPTLLIAGDHDPIVSPDQSRLIARHLQLGMLVMLEGAGHLPMSERRDEYHADLARWLAQYP